IAFARRPAFGIDGDKKAEAFYQTAEHQLLHFVTSHASELLALVEADGWRTIDQCPPHSRIIASGWQKPSRTVKGYWWVHEDVADEKGRPIDRPHAMYFRLLPERPDFPPPEPAQ
ncbi:MAG TPA: hypothetical protein DCL48_12725, partial [Alphaproteobacteria bacterium]|nr:hypothetical protein [Alphaproteobacteria bacterium]